MNKPIRVRTAANIMTVAVLSGFLGACGGGGGLGGFGGFGGGTQPTVEEPPAAPELPSTIRADEIVGRWGYAAYHKPEDRARTEAAARGQCKNPMSSGRDRPAA